ncbi:hypothetical protein [Curtobacterium poinsettiae]|uniref:hypothetical protein n=1 Tax=Curtobacterium poinsettiae TaxID=159612 RepID=UPI00217EF2DB|nr:hypothetical protein [Curtobacterium flaccumfaciens]MCS6578263.1 hypothetical protein [Curtobacterium flaccumfaciens]
MTETSFPIVDQKLTDGAWAQTVGAVGNGILDDWGSPYRITVNTNDTVTIRKSTTSGFARAVVNGYGHQMDADITLPVPAVSSPTRYYVGLLYNPAVRKASDPAFDPTVDLPVKLVVLKGPEVPLSGTQEFLTLHQFSRGAGQTLAASTLFSPLPSIRPSIQVDSKASLMEMSPLLFLRGTEAYCVDVDFAYRSSGTASSPQWRRAQSIDALPSADDNVDTDVTPASGRVRIAGESFSTDADRLVFITVTGTAVGAHQNNASGLLSVVLNDENVLHPSSCRLSRIRGGAGIFFSVSGIARTKGGANVLRVFLDADQDSDTIRTSGVQIGVVSF